VATVRLQRLPGKYSGRLGQGLNLLEPGHDAVPTGYH
jgi:hypothetical protein